MESKETTDDSDISQDKTSEPTTKTRPADKVTSVRRYLIIGVRLLDFTLNKLAYPP